MDIHEMGGCRMGKDPRTSLLNEWNQLHLCKNVFVTDGACMATTGNQSPSILYMALTARAANYAAAQVKKENLVRHFVDPLPELPGPHSFLSEKDAVKIRQTFETGTIGNLRNRVIRFTKQMTGMADPDIRKIIRERLARCPFKELAKCAL